MVKCQTTFPKKLWRKETAKLVIPTLKLDKPTIRKRMNLLRFWKIAKKRLRGGGFYLDKISSKLDTIEFQNQNLIREIALLKGEIAKNHKKFTTLEKDIVLLKNILLDQSNNKLTQVFNTIYETNAWGYGSGSGSNENLCKGYVQFLQQFFQRNNIKSIVDIGCGDWQFSKNINFDGILYKGYDVASFVVNRNLAKYKKSNIDFIHYNGDFSVLPKADLAICKDVLQHLPNHNIRQFIDNLSKYKYVLIANDIGLVGENNDILLDVYAYRSLDLRSEPFNLPLEVVFEFIRQPREPNIAVMLWKNPNLVV